MKNNSNNSKSETASDSDENAYEERLGSQSLSEDDRALMDMYAEQVADLLLKCYFASKANLRKEPNP
jgi:hypothetical protein